MQGTFEKNKKWQIHWQLQISETNSLLMQGTFEKNKKWQIHWETKNQRGILYLCKVLLRRTKNGSSKDQRRILYLFTCAKRTLKYQKIRSLETRSWWPSIVRNIVLRHTDKSLANFFLQWKCRFLTIYQAQTRLFASCCSYFLMAMFFLQWSRGFFAHQCLITPPLSLGLLNKQNFVTHKNTDF
jgi:hypothetical protein